MSCRLHPIPLGSLAILIRPRRDVCLSIRKMCRSHRPARRPDIVTPILIVSVIGCAAIIGLTMISAFQPGAHPPTRTSENVLTPASTLNKAGSDPRLVVDVEKAFANEPLSLKVTLDSATDH